MDFLKDYKIYLNTPFKATTVMKLKRMCHVVIPEDKVLSHVWLCDPMDCNPPDSSVHGIF